eukprot:1605304-Pleurochrysis_carterae.AAC.1
MLAWESRVGAVWVGLRIHPFRLRLQRRSPLPKASAPLRCLRPERRTQPGHQIPRHRLHRVRLTP